MKLADLTGPDAPATITVPQACSLLGVGIKVGYEAVQLGTLPALHLGRRVVIPVPALVALLSSSPTEKV